VLPLGPVFGTTLWSLPRGHFAAAAMSRSPRAFAQKMREVRFQAITRLPLSAYVPRASTDGYVFHASRAWGGRHADTNAPRQRFLDACATLGVPVDGGLGDARMPLAEYVQRTQRSAVVFNCPAVHRCLGWKLGEYLALGKAVVSTPLARELPAPLVHGRHVHLVDDDVESIAAGVRAVLADADYRRRLERGARAWFDDHLAPPKVAQRLVAHGRA
jgi:glycosyltransferase involved in cell wall biosynthesis